MTRGPGSGFGSRKLDRFLLQGVGSAQQLFHGDARRRAAGSAGHRLNRHFSGHRADRQTAKRRERPSLHPIHRKRLAPASTRLPHLVILLDWRRGSVRCGAVRHRGDCCQIKGSERRSNEALHRNSPSLVGRNVRIRWRQKWPSSALAANALFRSNQSESAIGSGNETRAGPGKWPRTRHAHVRPASGAVRGDDSQQRRDGISGPSSVGRRSVRGLPRRSQNASRRGGGRRSGRG
jgi:hypothetical protein